jgi:hypothetical protein
MTGPEFETFLALIYTDPAARRRFLDDPLEEAALAGLTPAEARELAAIDREGLKLAARSFERKRAGKQAHRK